MPKASCRSFQAEPFKEKRRIYTPGDRLLASRSDPYFRGFDQKLADYWRELEWEARI